MLFEELSFVPEPCLVLVLVPLVPLEPSFLSVALRALVTLIAPVPPPRTRLGVVVPSVDFFGTPERLRFASPNARFLCLLSY